MGKPLNLIGETFGKLKVISKLDQRDQNAKVLWACQCSCGNSTNVNTKNLRTGNTRSCGCLHKETITKHGMRNTRTYRIWVSLKHRPYNAPVCKRWAKFENFLADMGEVPEGLTIDRINNAKGYSPKNCRWATHLQQTLNRSITRNITYQGKTQCLSHWAKEIGMRHDTLTHRLNAGWSIEKALTTPVKEYK